MKIQSIYIEGFGKWHQTSFSFDSNFHLFYGKNEAGKSTLYHFILTILFGFQDKRKKEQVNYQPLHGGLYGGKLIFHHDQYGRVQVERIKEKNNGKATVQLEGGGSGEDELLARIIAPLNRQLFQEIYTFQQQQLQQFNQFSEDHIQQLLLSLGLAGSAKLIAERQGMVRKSQEIFKPKGRQPVLNQAIDALHTVQRVIHQQEQTITDYQQIEECYRETTKELDTIAKEKQNAEIKRQVLLKQLDYWALYEEWQTLLREKATSQESELKKEEVNLLQEIYQKDQLLQQEQIRIEESSTELATREESPLFFFFLKNEEQFRKVLSGQVEVERLLAEESWRTRQQYQLEENIKKLTGQYGWSDKQLPHLPSEREQDDFQNLVTQKAELKKKQEKLEHEESQLMETKHLEEKNIEKIESLYGETLFQRPKQPKKVGWFSVGMGMVISLLLIFLGVFLSKYRIPLAIIAIVAMAWSIYRLVSNLSQPGTTELENKTKWQNSLSRLDQLEEQLFTIVEEEGQLNAALEELKTKEQLLAISFGYNVDTSASDWLQSLDSIERIHSLAQEQAENLKEIKQLTKQLMNYQEELSFLEGWLPIRLDEHSDALKKVRKLVEEFDHMKLDQAVNSSSEGHWFLQLQKIKLQRQQLFQQNQTFLNGKGLSQFSEIPQAIEAYNISEKRKQRISELENLLMDIFPKESIVKKEELEDAVRKNKEQIFYLEKEQTEGQQEKEKCLYQMEKLSKDGELTDLYQQEADQIAAIQELAEEWMVQQLSIQLITESMARLSELQLPNLLQQAGKVFAQLTNQQYVSLKFFEDQLYLIRKTGDRITIQECSTGTRDQLFLALRFAFVSLHSQVCPCPVIIDDGWLHYDSWRKRNLVRLLLEMSQQRQTICFSSDQELFAYVKEENKKITILE